MKPCQKLSQTVISSKRRTVAGQDKTAVILSRTVNRVVTWQNQISQILFAVCYWSSQMLFRFWRNGSGSLALPSLQFSEHAGTAYLKSVTRDGNTGNVLHNLSRKHTVEYQEFMKPGKNWKSCFQSDITCRYVCQCFSWFYSVVGLMKDNNFEKSPYIKFWSYHSTLFWN